MTDWDDVHWSETGLPDWQHDDGVPVVYLSPVLRLCARLDDDGNGVAQRQRGTEAHGMWLAELGESVLRTERSRYTGIIMAMPELANYPLIRAALLRDIWPEE